MSLFTITFDSSEEEMEEDVQLRIIPTFPPKGEKPLISRPNSHSSKRVVPIINSNLESEPKPSLSTLDFSEEELEDEIIQNLPHQITQPGLQRKKRGPNRGRVRGRGRTRRNSYNAHLPEKNNPIRSKTSNMSNSTDQNGKIQEVVQGCKTVTRKSSHKSQSTQNELNTTSTITKSASMSLQHPKCQVPKPCTPKAFPLIPHIPSNQNNQKPNTSLDPSQTRFLSSEDSSYSEPAISTPSRRASSGSFDLPTKEKFFGDIHLNPSIFSNLGLNEEPNVTEFRVFTLIKKKHFMMRGPRLHYQLLLENHPQYHTKIKIGKALLTINISQGTEMHFSDTSFAACILVSGDKMKFDLRDRDIYGEELASIQYQKDKSTSEHVMVVNFFAGKEFYPTKVITVQTKTVSEREGEMVLQSLKGQEIIKIWSEGSDVIQIYGPAKMHPLFFMTLGISYDLSPSDS